MQRYIWMCVLLVSASNMKACDICGCSVMSGNPGILPGIQSHFFGYKFTSRAFNNTHPPSIINPVGARSHNLFRTHELWARWYPSGRFQVFASMPVNDYRMEEEGVVKSIKGIGDLSLLLNYKLLDKTDSNSGFRQLLFVGAGSKFKTGRFDPDEIAGFQLGSGTQDWMGYLSYTARIKSIGALTEINARKMGTNANNYNFGDKYFVSEKLFYFLETPKIRFLPQAGLSYEKSGIDKLNGIVQDYTGGQAWFANLALDTYFSNFNLGMSWSLPIKQTVGDGLIKESTRLQINCLYFIQRKTCK